MKTIPEITAEWKAKGSDWLPNVMEIDNALEVCTAAAESPTPPTRDEWIAFATELAAHTSQDKHGDYRKAINDVLFDQGVYCSEEDDRKQIPLDDLPKIVRDVIIAAERQLNTSPEMAATCVLSAIAVSVQGLYNVEQPRYGTLPLNLYTLAIAGTGVGKSVVYNRLTEGITRFEDDDKKARKDEIASYQLAIASYRKRRDAEVAKMDQAQILAWMRANPAPIEPLKVRRIEKRFSTNGILKLFTNASSLGLFNAEAGSFFDSHSMNNQVVEFMATLCDLYGGDPCSKETGIESIHVSKRRLSALLMIQPHIINGFLTDPRFAQQGITQRFLIMACPARPRMKILQQNGGASAYAFQDEKAFSVFNQRLYDKIATPMNYDVDFELNLPTIPFDGEGRADHDSPACRLIIDWANGLTDRMNDTSDRPYELVEGLYNRIHEVAYKIAGALAVFDNKPCIGLADAKAGIALAQYFLDERLRIEMTLRPISKEGAIYDGALDVLKYLQRLHSRTGEMSWPEREIRSNVRVLKTDRRDKIWKELKEQNWALRTTRGVYGGNDTYTITLTNQGKRYKGN